MHKVMAKFLLFSLSAVFVSLLIFPFGCKSKIKEPVLSDKPLAVFQKDLLDVAFETATLIPINPHIKDRTKAQEGVVAVCLELYQPKQALRYIESIENWRRGICYADLAFYCAKQNYPDETKKYLDLAVQISEQDHGQEWRSDRVKERIAQTKAVLKNIDKEIDNSIESNAVDGNDTSFDEQVKALDALMKSGSFEVVKSTFNAYTELFDRYYDDIEKRSFAEEKVKTSWEKLPVFVRVELLVKLSDFALGHSDKNKAIELANDAQQVIDNNEIPLENRIPMAATLVDLRFRAGDIEKARIDANKAYEMFNSKKEKIIDIYRAETIRPLAESYQKMGDTKTSLMVYKQAVEEGVQNPNSRPRAEDLSATFCSMALYGVEPDAELWKRIREISEGLGQPW